MAILLSIAPPVDAGLSAASADDWRIDPVRSATPPDPSSAIMQLRSITCACCLANTTLCDDAATCIDARPCGSSGLGDLLVAS
ncbi:MAG: hypothetical protein R2856_12085 [Caldilineaceae bacterium]